MNYALHRSLCSRMIGNFPENGYETTLFGNFFLGCEDVHNTIRRAMDTWAFNHKNIKILDATHGV